MKVLLIHENNHGVIGVVKDVNSAVSFLIKENWLNEKTSICYDNGDDYEWGTVEKAYGKDWEHFLRSLTIGLFNEIWEDCFYLEEEEVFGTP